MDFEPTLPIAISYIGSKYLLFDIEMVTWLRRVHHVCGVMSGTLPQSPSQNLFLGLPVQIMPEEAQLLVDKGIGFIVDDAKAHSQALDHEDPARSAAYKSDLQRKGERVALAREQEKAEQKRHSLQKAKIKAGQRPKPPPEEPVRQSPPEETSASSGQPSMAEDENESALFDSTSTIRPNVQNSSTELAAFGIVPATSKLFLPEVSDPPPKSDSIALLPNVPSSYALYKHLHEKAYFVTPGLRFGCQYCVYPGDPLRFHSHFLAVGKEWDEEIDLMSIVGGGRLGTGVKKGFLIGGTEPTSAESTAKGQQGVKVRTFSIEWAAM